MAPDLGLAVRVALALRVSSPGQLVSLAAVAGTAVTFTFHRPPLAHQLAAFERFRDAPYLGLFFEMRCVDEETEYLSPKGWRRIDEYDGGLVAQWNYNTREASFVKPTNYIKVVRGPMINIKLSTGVDQCLSYDHRVPILPTGPDYVCKRGLRVTTTTVSALELFKILAPGRTRARALPGTFFGTDLGGSGINLTNEKLRVQIAVMADGSFTRASTGQCIMNLKKEYKKIRIRQLLFEANIEYREKPGFVDGFSRFIFYAPMMIKHYDARFWQATSEQLTIIADEAPRWDGNIYSNGSLIYRSMVVEDVDFSQTKSESITLV